MKFSAIPKTVACKAKKSISLVIIALLAVTAVLPFMPVSVFAAEHTSTLNLLEVRQNTTGDSYYWNNKTDTLTLTNITINTTDRYGIRIPDGATVVLEGNNTISASYAALDIEGAAYFRGNGTLTLNGGEIGFLNPTNMSDKRVIIEDGTYVINSSGVGISSPSAVWSQTGGNITVNSAGEAVNGREIRLQGGVFTANNTVHATNKLVILYTTLNITAPKSALVSDKTLSINGVAMKSGENKIEEYNGENAITSTPLSRKRTTSMLYGESVSIAADYITAVVAALIIAAVIVVPKVLKKKKLRLALEKYEAEQKAKQSEKGAK